MTEEMLEILIGKFLDSEITPGEKRLLDEELEHNAESRRLFEAFQRMHVKSRAVLEGATQAGSAAEVFEQAWQQAGGRAARPGYAGWRRFAAGVAAGLVMGAGAFTLIATRPTHTVTEGTPVANIDPAQGPVMAETPVEWTPANGTPGDVIRQVDLYNFTDDSGGQWLIEGLREKRVQPAVYYQDL